MRARYVLAPEAALDLGEIWRHLKNQGSVAGGKSWFRTLAQEPDR
jgi:plasmid stabilization system protein ParE